MACMHVRRTILWPKRSPAQPPEQALGRHDSWLECSLLVPVRVVTVDPVPRACCILRCIRRFGAICHRCSGCLKQLLGHCCLPQPTQGPILGGVIGSCRRFRETGEGISCNPELSLVRQPPWKPDASRALAQGVTWPTRLYQALGLPISKE
jgi:hypothetical protein